ncbi:hypothetical protein GN244_ATG10005 [Phytophthora infestans]|uniref:Uncharacterized protein n=1 Tax=Phytophthora infestans TaxID=4787 RepID=A0A833WD44_PHYIN|nr:hypothetical protein GN244_ATG10005 [Phytophthora infestans]
MLSGSYWEGLTISSFVNFPRRLEFERLSLSSSMVSSNTIFSAVFALAVVVHNASAHGYMYIPLAEFTNSVTSAWIMQIEPQWSGD